MTSVLQDPRPRRAHIFARDPREHYIDPAWVSRRLFEVENFGPPGATVLDFACGWGAILCTAADAGYRPQGSDLVDTRKCDELKLDGIPFAVRDFQVPAAIKVTSVVSNPPFDLIEPCCRRALEIAQYKVAMISPLPRVGIDPGVRGALAIIIINDGAAPQLVDAVDIPVTDLGPKERTDALSVRDWIAAHQPQAAFIERAQAMPKQGASSGFKYGRAVGAIEAAIALCGIPLTLVEPSQWKKFHGVRGREKEPSRQRALQLFPSAHALLARKMDHGRAKAALIALLRRAAMKRKRHRAFRSEAEQAKIEDRRLRGWRRWHEEKLHEALAGPQGLALWEICVFLDDMTLQAGPELIALIKKQPWSYVDSEDRFCILRHIDLKIVELRERHGLPPFDNPIGDGLNVSLTIKKLIAPQFLETGIQAGGSGEPEHRRSDMSNDVVKSPEEIDGFDTYEDRVEGHEERVSNQVIQGTLVKFTNESMYETRDGEELPTDELELAVVDTIRVVQKWCDQQPVETKNS